MNTRPERDEVTGTETTGHEWDGIRELDTPLPKWWLYVFYASIIWSIGYWVVMPAWPVVWGETGFTKGVIGYSQRDVVTNEIEKAKQEFASHRVQVASLSLDQITKNEDVYFLAAASGKAAFGDNCSGCHGTGAQGFEGFPNLLDDEWIWGGTLEEIQYTITHGIRWLEDLDTRYSEMPRFLADELLDEDQVADVTQYVVSLTGETRDVDAVARGAAVYAQECALCHMADGAGDPTQGAPSLVDQIWLYGGTERDIYDAVANSRFGVMPAWGGRLDEVTIKELAIYIHSLGGTEAAPAEVSSLSFDDSNGKTSLE